MPDDQNQAGLKTLNQTLLLVSLPIGVLMFALPVFGRRIGASPLEIGLFYSVFSFATTLLRPLMGWALDRYGRKSLFMAGLLIYTLTRLWLGFAHSSLQIHLIRLLEGMGTALVWLSALTMAADQAGGKAQGQAQGRLSEYASRGAIIGAFIGFTLLAHFEFMTGWKYMLLFFTGVSLLAMLHAWRKVPETRPVNPATKKRAALPRSTDWYLLLFLTAATAASWSMLTPTIMVYLQDSMTTHVSILGLAYLPAALIWAVLPSKLGKLADRVGLKPMMLLGLALSALTSFLIPLAGGVTMLAVLWACQALGHSAGDPAEAAMVDRLADQHARGRAFGVFTAASGLGASAGPALGGWLYQSAGQLSPFIANGFFLLLCTLLLLLNMKTRHSPAGQARGSNQGDPHDPRA